MKHEGCCMKDVGRPGRHSPQQATHASVLQSVTRACSFVGQNGTAWNVTKNFSANKTLSGWCWCYQQYMWSGVCCSSMYPLRYFPPATRTSNKYCHTLLDLFSIYWLVRVSSIIIFPLLSFPIEWLKIFDVGLVRLWTWTWTAKGDSLKPQPYYLLPFCL